LNVLNDLSFNRSGFYIISRIIISILSRISLIRGITRIYFLNYFSPFWAKSLSYLRKLNHFAYNTSELVFNEILREKLLFKYVFIAIRNFKNPFLKNFIPQMQVFFHRDLVLSKYHIYLPLSRKNPFIVVLNTTNVNVYIKLYDMVILKTL